jgi:hypothetical protein
MTNKATLHSLIDRLPDTGLEPVEAFLEKWCAEHYPIPKAFLNAPEVEEPFTEEEAAEIQEAYAEIAQGHYVTWEEMCAQLNGNS